MASLKDLKARINSIKSTQKITKAMKMVAASKLRKAKDRAKAAESYANRMAQLVSNLSGSAIIELPLLSGTGDDKKNLVIVVTSDRGLCGSSNTASVREALRFISELESQGKEVSIYCIGKKGYDLMKRSYGSKVVGNCDSTIKGAVSFEQVNEVSESILSMLDEGSLDCCYIFFNHFVSSISQELKKQKLIPLEYEVIGEEGGNNDGNNENTSMKTAAQEGGDSPVLYSYEPSEEEILTEILPKNLKVQLYRAMLDSCASEHGARMTAMDNASRNCGDMVTKLNLVYNRTRQAYITRELIEIISGAEAL